MDTSTVTDNAPVESEADKAVRTYLEFLRDPASIVDQDEINRLTAELDAETDLLEQLRIASQIAVLKNGNPAEVREAFVEHAQEWAKTNLETDEVEAFRFMGVEPGVLRDAGFRIRGGGKRKSERVSADEVEAAIPPKGTQFHIGDVVRESGGSPAAVRTRVLKLVEEGEIINLGPDPDHEGKGRVPNLYERI